MFSLDLLCVHPEYLDSIFFHYPNTAQPGVGTRFVFIFLVPAVRGFPTCNRRTIVALSGQAATYSLPEHVARTMCFPAGMSALVLHGLESFKTLTGEHRRSLNTRQLLNIQCSCELWSDIFSVWFYVFSTRSHYFGGIGIRP